MAILTGMLSVAEFARLPQPEGGVRQELHHGELLELPPVKILHLMLQMRLVSLVRTLCDLSVYGVTTEFPFRPVPGFDVRVADVALFRLAYASRTLHNDYFSGVPEIVIEVLSPSNTASEMLDRETICLRNGGKEFWLVDPNRKTVKVVRADGYSQVYGVEGAIESGVLDGRIAVSDIFDSVA